MLENRKALSRVAFEVWAAGSSVDSTRPSPSMPSITIPMIHTGPRGSPEARQCIDMLGFLRQIER